MSAQPENDLTDLRERLDQANRRLAYEANLSRTSADEATRLRGKAEGVRLAMSYLDEIVRTERA